MICFLPLVHLDFSLQSVAVLCHDAEIAIAKVCVIGCGASNMNQFVHQLILGSVAVRRDACFSGPVDKLGKLHSALLIFPDNDLGKRDQEKA